MTGHEALLLLALNLEITSVIVTMCVDGNNSERKLESVVDPNVISGNIG